MKLGSAVATAVLASAVLALPANAGVATLTSDKPCYGGADTVRLKGTGFTPGSGVSFTVQENAQTPVRLRETATSDATGTFDLGLPAPFTTTKDRRVQTVTAIDEVNPAITAARPVKLSIVRVKVRPQSGRPSRVRRIRATGFTTGSTLYAHKTRGKSKKTIRIGRLRGGCHSLSVRARLFSRTAKVGKYRIQFDTFRKYKRTRLQKVPFTIEIFRGVGGSSGAARAAHAGMGGSLRTRWTRLVD